MISILDYGAGNTNSVVRMIEKVGGRSQRVSSPDEILNSKKLIIPGVGAYDHGVRRLRDNGLIEALNVIAMEKQVPILGICLGMQLMCKRSEEGLLPGLGWIDADVLRFSPTQGANLRVPHMGWNTLSIVKENSLLPLEATEKRFYFVHSYKVKCHDSSDVVAFTSYGEDFVSAFQRKNLFGVQFHPEKSHRFGMTLFRNFVEVNLD